MALEFLLRNPSHKLDTFQSILDQSGFGSLKVYILLAFLINLYNSCNLYLWKKKRVICEYDTNKVIINHYNMEIYSLFFKILMKTKFVKGALSSTFLTNKPTSIIRPRMTRTTKMNLPFETSKSLSPNYTSSVLLKVIICVSKG